MACARDRLMACWSETREWNTPRLSRCLLSLARKPLTALIQDAEEGVKVKRPSAGGARAYMFPVKDENVGVSSAWRTAGR